MINLFPITKVIAWIAVSYALLVLSFTLLFNLTGFSTLNIAVKGAVVLNLVLFAIAAFAWQWLWKLIPKLNDWIYPDLNGYWDVEIDWHWGTKSGTKPAVAHIKQSLLEFSIELESDESESETLIVVPHKHSKSARPGLYYIYRSEGKTGAAKKQDPHTGAALLKLSMDSNDHMYGNYFTNRSTNGQYTLRRITET
jgi:hypothetical protein